MNNKPLASNNTIQASSSATSGYFAEVVESSLDHLIAQSWDWNSFPEFGSLVHIESKTHIYFGIVVQIQTGSMDPMRYPFPYKKTEDELMMEQPQIFEFLKTIFNVQVIGYSEKRGVNADRIFYLLPPTPAKIHAFVAESSPETYARFFANTTFLDLLFAFQAKIPNLDELLLAILRRLIRQNQLSQDKLDQFCKSFSLLTGNDYRRLKLFLKRIENIT